MARKLTLNAVAAQLDLAYLTDVYTTETATSAPGDNLSREKEKESGTAFDRLVLEEGHRPMIVSLVAQHFRDKECQTGQRDHVDIVKGKGTGTKKSSYITPCA